MSVLFGRKTPIYEKHIKSFLNQDGHFDTSAISFKAIVQESLLYDEITLKITDCEKNVTLEFEIGNEDETQNSIEKINTLIKFLGEAKVILHEAIEAKKEQAAKDKLKAEEKKNSVTEDPKPSTDED